MDYQIITSIFPAKKGDKYGNDALRRLKVFCEKNGIDPKHACSIEDDSGHVKAWKIMSTRDSVYLPRRK